MHTSTSHLHISHSHSTQFDLISLSSKRQWCMEAEGFMMITLGESQVFSYSRWRCSHFSSLAFHASNCQPRAVLHFLRLTQSAVSCKQFVGNNLPSELQSGTCVTSTQRQFKWLLGDEIWQRIQQNKPYSIFHLLIKVLFICCTR